VVVDATDAGYALVADGGARKVVHPKRKNVKHLVAHPDGDSELLQRVAAGEKITDDLVRRALKRCWADAIALMNSKTKEAEA
jgi:ribosomal protein L14E/L6E/L27E